MTLTENYSPVFDLFPFSRIDKNNSVVTGETIFRSTKHNALSLSMEMPVNNYLKTPEEIERELLSAAHEHNPDIQKIKERKDNLPASMISTNAFMIMHNADEIIPGFMEENY